MIENVIHSFSRGGPACIGDGDRWKRLRSCALLNVAWTRGVHISAWPAASMRQGAWWAVAQPAARLRTHAGEQTCMGTPSHLLLALLCLRPIRKRMEGTHNRRPSSIHNHPHRSQFRVDLGGLLRIKCLRITCCDGQVLGLHQDAPIFRAREWWQARRPTRGLPRRRPHRQLVAPLRHTRLHSGGQKRHGQIHRPRSWRRWLSRLPCCGDRRQAYHRQQLHRSRRAGDHVMLSGHPGGHRRACYRSECCHQVLCRWLSTSHVLMMTGAKSGANVALPRQGVTSRKCEVILLFLEDTPIFGHTPIFGVLPQSKACQRKRK